MPCPTCDHTMIAIALMNQQSVIFHCPRCGTLKTNLAGVVDVTVPKLVARHRELIGMIEPGPESRFLREALHRTGVSESVLPPEQRPSTE